MSDSKSEALCRVFARFHSIRISFALSDQDREREWKRIFANDANGNLAFRDSFVDLCQN